MIRRILHITFFIFLLIELYGQDVQFSQSSMTKSYVNPSYVGLSDNWNVSFLRRNQWFYVPRLMKTSFISAESFCSNSAFGFGGWALQNIEGEGSVRSTTLNGILAKTIGGRKKNSSRDSKGFDVFSAAMQMGFIQKTIDWSELVFSDQLDPRYGLINNTNALPQNNSSDLMLDFGAGIVYRRHIGGRYKKSKRNSRLHVKREGSFFTLGASVSHLNEPVESFLGINTKLPRKFTLHTSLALKGSNKSFANSPDNYFGITGIYTQQNKLHSITTGPLLALQDNLLLNILWRGNFGEFKNTDSYIVSILWSFHTIKREEKKSQSNGYDYDKRGLETAKNKISLGISYDYTTAPLDFSRTHGTIELTFRYDLIGRYLCPPESKRERKKLNKQLEYCPSVGNSSNRMRGNETEKEHSTKLKRNGDKSIRLNRIGL